jgi:hypothetical protein
VANALDQSSSILKDSLTGISEAEAARKAGPGLWSVLDCVEHLVLAERGMLSRAAAADTSNPLPVDPAREAQVTSGVANRTVRAESPARARPSGRFSTLAQALEQFDCARSETFAFLREHQSDLALRNASHPLFGSVTGVEMLLIMAGHTCRHAEQIREIRASIP